ncbi:unnamed protein product [Phytophthora lilii]|uniref:Unnamed protein product n=1 Tax=Phytophthora lilii TaxID=2077276 RepID=A0A9W6U7G4_9STRA|nr:unnamed protein product [Phytophthora lilii]
MATPVSPSTHFSAQQRDAIHARRPGLTFGTVLAVVAVVGRVVVAPLMLLMVFGLTKYITSGRMFIGSEDSYFAFSAEDAVMIGGCTGCQIGCRNAVLQMSFFGQEALMSKPLFENLYTMDFSNYSQLSTDALDLADALENDGTVCMSGFDEWGSPITTFKGKPQMVLDVVETLKLSVIPQVLLEVEIAVKTVAQCTTDWVLEAHLRLFKFPTAKASLDFSAVSVADFTVFPEKTECRPNVSNSDLVGSRLALATDGTDLLAVVPDFLRLFPYSFVSSLPQVSRTIATSEDYGKVLQPLFHGYFGGCRVREVNTSGVYIENECSINQHWVNYGLMLQAPDDLPVCSTGDVCVHNYYNSLWEFVAEVDPSVEDRLTMAINVFRSRFADRVKLSMLPGLVVAQMLVMGVISLYQVMSHKRSVLLTQIWAYRCQNGRMQVLYLAQIMYHLIMNSDLYYLGLATGTLTTEALTNLAFSFFAFSYSFVNLLKARSGEQQLDRHFRLTWETMQVIVTFFTTFALYSVRQTSLVFILNQNGELLQKTTARGAAMCNLSDSCIVFKHNLVLIAIAASLALGAVAGVVSHLTLKHAQWEARRVEIKTGKSSPSMRSVAPHDTTGPSKDFLKATSRPTFRRPRITGFGPSIKPEAGDNDPVKPELGPSVSCIFRDGQPLPPLTSFERHCLGAPFSRLFTDCGDIAYTTYEGRRCSTVEAILLTGFLFYGEHVLDVATQLRIQQIEQVEITISTGSRPVGDVRYVMTVRHAGAHAVWRMHRSFDEYHVFQERLLGALRHGHVCNAGCPWLESFLTSYFPARSAKLLPHWWDSTKRLVAHRREALTHVMQTVQVFLCSRQNQACPVLSSGVTSEFLDFVYGQVVDDKRVLARAMARDAATVTAAALRSARSRSPSPCRHSFVSVQEGEENYQDDPEVSIDQKSDVEENLRCELCGLRMPERNVYVTQLHCGHRFHDECILPRLNEALKCPTCGARDDEA